MGVMDGRSTLTGQEEELPLDAGAALDPLEDDELLEDEEPLPEDELSELLELLEEAGIELEPLLAPARESVR